MCHFLQIALLIPYVQCTIRDLKWPPRGSLYLGEFRILYFHPTKVPVLCEKQYICDIGEGHHRPDT
jgi:hypothetical protein